MEYISVVALKLSHVIFPTGCYIILNVEFLVCLAAQDVHCPGHLLSLNKSFVPLKHMCMRHTVFPYIHVFMCRKVWLLFCQFYKKKIQVNVTYELRKTSPISSMNSTCS